MRTARGRLIKAVLDMEEGDVLYTDFDQRVLSAYRLRNIVTRKFWVIRTFGVNQQPEVKGITEIVAVGKPYDDRKQTK